MKQVMLAIWLGWLGGMAWAQPAPTPLPPEETGARAIYDQDEVILGEFSRCFPTDSRYNDVLNRITVRVLPHVGEVFGPDPPRVTFGVFLSRLGFNALALRRLVLVDSLLLDGLKRLCEGVAVAGTMQNPYTERLAEYIVALHAQGVPQPWKLSTFDPRNPYLIPPPVGLTEPLEGLAEELFEETLAAWICHELSHTFLDHVREKYLAAEELRKTLPSTTDERAVSEYVNHRLGPKTELEADLYGARLALASGYSLEGFRRWYLFLNRLEEKGPPGGMEDPLWRVHPTPAERWRAVKVVRLKP